MSGLIPSLGRLRPDDPAAIRRVAAQLEGVFLREMLKPLETQDPDADLLGGDEAGSQYRQMHLDALADSAAGGLGLARMIEDHLARSARLGRQP